MNPQNFINNAIQNWLAIHPRINWMVDHPLWTLALVIAAFFLFAGLLNAIARFTEQFWIALLRSPLTLAQWVFRGSPKVLALVQFKRKEDPQKQLKEVLDRLEELRKEEDQLIEKVKGLLGSQRKNSI